MSAVEKITDANIMERLLIEGDLSKLNSEQRLSYYKKVCDSTGLNYLTQPFSYIVLNNKLVLYAKRDATDQLRKIHKVSIEISDRQFHDDVYIVTAKAKDSTGRVDESTGAVSIAGLKGDFKVNALLKAETKAKRRVTLSICGLGILDESELDTMPGATDVKDVSPAEAPKPVLKTVQSEKPVAPPSPPEPVNEKHFKAGDYMITWGKKYPGQTLHDIGLENAMSYAQWFVQDAKKKGKPLDARVAELVQAVANYDEELNGMGKIPF